MDSNSIFDNRVLIATIISWIIAQSIKILLGLVREKRFNFSWFTTTGGMPSSHAAGVSTLATCIGFAEGFTSSIFAFAVIFAFITMFDAQTSRRSIGVQAKLLNLITEDIYAGRSVSEQKLKELIGHTPVEVFVGLLLGVLIGCAYYL